MSFENIPTEENPFKEAETSPWRVVGVFKNVETDEEEQEQVYYASDEVSAQRLKKKLESTDPNKGWYSEKNPDYKEPVGEEDEVLEEV